MVSITSSLLSGFGSGVVVDKGGYLMNDRMRYFYLDPKDVNSLQPGKRMRQTINPAMALKDGKPWIAFGTPGSDTQPQTQLQFFLNVAEFGMNVQEALEQPTVISNSFRDSYQPHDVKGKLLTPALLPEERAGGAGGEGPPARHPQREGRRLGESDPDRSADRRADGRRQPDRRQLCHGVVRLQISECRFIGREDIMRVLKAFAVAVVCAASFWAVSARPQAAADPLTLVTLSSRADLVSGGDALVEIRSAAGASAKVTVTVNDRDVSQAFRADAARKSLVGLVDGLKVGRNTIVAKAGSQTARLEVTNYPITGPILSGDHITPFACNTVQSGLGEPLDADCSAKTKVEYFDRSTPATPVCRRAWPRARPRPSSRSIPRPRAPPTSLRRRRAKARPCRTSCASSRGRSTARSTASRSSTIRRARPARRGPRAPVGTTRS